MHPIWDNAFPGDVVTTSTDYGNVELVLGRENRRSGWVMFKLFNLEEGRMVNMLVLPWWMTGGIWRDGRQL